MLIKEQMIERNKYGEKISYLTLFHCYPGFLFRVFLRREFPNLRYAVTYPFDLLFSLLFFIYIERCLFPLNFSSYYSSITSNG